MAPRETWTDERLDDLNQRVDDGFRETREEIRALRLELRQEIHGVRDGLRQEIHETRQELSGRLDRLQLTLIGGLLAVIVSIFVERL